jgi:asparagine synthase (glutamine-hydrolysing)
VSGASGAPGLRPLEVASGVVFGIATRQRRPFGVEAQAPRAIVESEILPALLRPPCVVAFSGGRASSLVLRAAVRLARREGLEVPVPATLRLRKQRPAERLAQERVVIRLGLTEWLRLPVADDLDPVGPAAMAALRRYGLLWPAGAHVFTPLVGWAFGGSLITGLGHHDGAHYRAQALSGDGGLMSWLRPHARRAVRARLRMDGRAFTLAEGSGDDVVRTPRQLEVRVALMARIAAESRVELHHPLLHPAFARSLFQCSAPAASLPLMKSSWPRLTSTPG